MFTLSRAGNNVPAEVQRWQYFLLQQNITETGAIDASFGGKTELGTKIFQMKSGISAHGRVDEKTLEAASGKGYSILNSDYYSQRSSLAWPPKPDGLQSPTNAWRNRKFTCFKFLQKPLSQRPDAESIVIKGSCDGAVSDWEDAFITDHVDNRFRHAAGYRGSFRCHREMVPPLRALLQAWEEQSLLHLVLNYAGCFVPRYMRDKAPPGSGGHSTRNSADVETLSNHSFGSAIDISTTWNWLGETPARCGAKGSVRELVAAANEQGFYWGGHYSGRKDGMHFELTE